MVKRRPRLKSHSRHVHVTAIAMSSESCAACRICCLAASCSLLAARHCCLLFLSAAAACVVLCALPTPRRLSLAVPAVTALKEPHALINRIARWRPRIIRE